MPENEGMAQGYLLTQALDSMGVELIAYDHTIPVGGEPSTLKRARRGSCGMGCTIHEFEYLRPDNATDLLSAVNVPVWRESDVSPSLAPVEEFTWDVRRRAQTT